MLTAPLHGLVLAGGRSTRMGVDKGRLRRPISGTPQWSHCASLLAACCAQVFVSCRADQVAGLPSTLLPLVDLPSLGELGPATGLLTAHRHSPGAAWLVLAVDFPFATPDALHRLVRSRAPGTLGTAYVNDAGVLEPLFALWEPAGLARLESAPAQGPRRVLDTGPCTRLPPDSPRLLVNVNTPAELAEAGMFLPRT